MRHSTRAKGNEGETLAAGFLESIGCTILERNYRYERGEIDIIAQDGPVLVFVEVKARNDARYGLPEESVTERKQGHLRRTAEGYLLEHQIEDRPCRFDVIAIDSLGTNPVIRHLKEAF